MVAHYSLGVYQSWKIEDSIFMWEKGPTVGHYKEIIYTDQADKAVVCFEET